MLFSVLEKECSYSLMNATKNAIIVAFVEQKFVICSIRYARCICVSSFLDNGTRFQPLPTYAFLHGVLVPLSESLARFSYCADCFVTASNAIPVCFCVVRLKIVYLCRLHMTEKLSKR